MAIYRIVVDVRSTEEVEIDDLAESVGKYVNGVVTERWLDGNGKVDANVGSHAHVSTERRACEDCSNMSYDGLN